MISNLRHAEAIKQERKLAEQRAWNIWGAVLMVLEAGQVIAYTLLGIFNGMGTDQIFLGLLIGLFAGMIVAGAPAAIYYAVATWHLPDDDTP